LQDADVVVSTIHKSKGMEFDDVYMLISEPRQLTDDMLRRYYVGITRAKHRLFIHTNSSLFFKSDIIQKRIDTTDYEMPNEIVLQLSHKDVNLGFFKSRKKEVLAKRAGQTLRYDNGYLYDINSGNPIGQLSQKIMSELSEWSEKNYFISDVSIRFIVAWRPKDAPKEEKEHAVLLVDLTLIKGNVEIDKNA
jgi:ATP-dependent DNA helicase RecQ